MTNLERILRDSLLFEDFEKVIKTLKDHNVQEIISDYVDEEVKEGREDLESKTANLEADLDSSNQKIEDIKESLSDLLDSLD